jgi:predicted aspartyl protease
VANAIYPKWKEARLQATANAALDGTGATGVYCALIDTGVTGYNSAHEFYSSISAAVVGTDQEITTKTYASGLFDGDNLTYTAVSGNSVEALILYVKNAGANTTWRLVAFIDTGVTGLPVTPNGGNITVTWNASGIFQL